MLRHLSFFGQDVINNIYGSEPWPLPELQISSISEDGEQDTLQKHHQAGIMLGTSSQLTKFKLFYRFLDCETHNRHNLVPIVCQSLDSESFRKQLLKRNFQADEKAQIRAALRARDEVQLKQLQSGGRWILRDLLHAGPFGSSSIKCVERWFCWSTSQFYVENLFVVSCLNCSFPTNLTFAYDLAKNHMFNTTKMMWIPNLKILRIFSSKLHVWTTSKQKTSQLQTSRPHFAGLFGLGSVEWSAGGAGLASCADLMGNVWEFVSEKWTNFWEII